MFVYMVAIWIMFEVIVVVIAGVVDTTRSTTASADTGGTESGGVSPTPHTGRSRQTVRPRPFPRAGSPARGPGTGRCILVARLADAPSTHTLGSESASLAEPGVLAVRLPRRPAYLIVNKRKSQG